MHHDSETDLDLAAFSAPELKTIARLTDWLSWKRKVERKLIIAGLGLVVLNPEPPAAAADGQAPRTAAEANGAHDNDEDPADVVHANWLSQNALACTLIRGTCLASNDRAYDATENARTLTDLFHALGAAVKPPPDVTLANIYQDLRGLSNDDFENLNAYIGAWHAVEREAEAIEAALPQPWLVEGFLAGLGPEFDGFKTRWIVGWSCFPSSASSVKLGTLEAVGVEARRWDEVARRQRARSEQGEGECRSCGKLGHSTRGCWVAQPELRSGVASKRRRKG